ncbi:MAG: alpha/beta fold hydrolase [Bacteroidota bacterium]|jgi:pimeloyl-ACP methyl ester carboxylesterase
MKWLLRIIVKLTLLLLVVSLVVGFVFYQADQSDAIIYTKYARPSSIRLPLMGMQVHLTDEGNPSDTTPLLFIHGTSSSLLTWEASKEILKKDYRIIRIDLPGFGLTGPNRDGIYTVDYNNQFIDSLLDLLKLNRVIIAGNSLGGSIAWQYALHRPDRVKGLILVDAAGIAPLRKMKGAIGFKVAQIPVLNKLMTVVTPRFLVKKSLEDAYGDPKKITDSLVNQYFDMVTRAGNRRALVDRIRTGWGYADSTLLQSIACPTFILWGRKDNLIPVENASVFQRQITNSQLQIWDELGHVPMEEDPVAFSSAVKKWRDSMVLR